jgi:hypothetical protein
MTYTITFDTLQCKKELISGGFNETQAEAQTRIIKNQTDEFNHLIESDLATKKDLENLYLKTVITLVGTVAILLAISLTILGYFLKH